MLVKVSFRAPLATEPVLDIGGTTVRGKITDTRGEHWQFYATDLRPHQRYTLSLRAGSGAALCEPWQLTTFPSRDERTEKVRILFFTCAGGHEALGFLPSAIRNRLFRRALSFAPDAGCEWRPYLLGSVFAQCRPIQYPTGRSASWRPVRPLGCRGRQ